MSWRFPWYWKDFQNEDERKRAEFSLERDRALEDYLATLGGGGVSWGSFQQTLPITWSSPNVLTNSVQNDLEFEYGDAGFATDATTPHLYVSCPAGTYLWAIELWGSDDWDGIITYSTGATSGTVCGTIHLEVIGNGSPSLSALQYFDTPVFEGVSGGALTYTGSTSTTTGRIYVECSFNDVSWLTTTNASGTIELHLLLVRVGDAPS